MKIHMHSFIGGCKGLIIDLHIGMSLNETSAAGIFSVGPEKLYLSRKSRINLQFMRTAAVLIFEPIICGILIENETWEIVQIAKEISLVRICVAPI